MALVYGILSEKMLLSQNPYFGPKKVPGLLNQIVIIVVIVNSIPKPVQGIMRSKKMW